MHYRRLNCACEKLTQYSQANFIALVLSDPDKQFRPIVVKHLVFCRHELKSNAKSLVVSHHQHKSKSKSLVFSHHELKSKSQSHVFSSLELKSNVKPHVLCSLDFKPNTLKHLTYYCLNFDSVISKLYFLCRLRFESYHVHSSYPEPDISHTLPDIECSADLHRFQLFVLIYSFINYTVIDSNKLSILSNNVYGRGLPKFFCWIIQPVINDISFSIHQQFAISDNHCISNFNAVLNLLPANDQHNYAELPKCLLKRQRANCDWIKRIRRSRNGNCKLLSKFGITYSSCDPTNSVSSARKLSYYLWHYNR